MRRSFALGFLAGLLWIAAGFVAHSQALSRTTNIAGGPAGNNYVGDFDSNMATLPNVSTLVTAAPVMINGIFCHNITGVAATVTITDNAAVVYVPGVSIAGNSVALFLNSGSKGLVMQGLKWNSNTASAINCQISGWN